MDLLPMIISSGCSRIDEIKIQRVVDFANFNPEKGKKRWGVKPEIFRKGVLEGRIPLHTGLFESMTMISDALGWNLENILEGWDMIVSKRLRQTSHFTVNPGEVAGWRQIAIGTVQGEMKISLKYYGFLSPTLEDDGMEAGNNTWIYGEPNLSLITKGTTQRGDLVTTNRLVNILPAVIEAKPGLISVLDLPATPPIPDK